MENALTREMIRQKRQEAHQAIEKARATLADCDSAERILDAFGVPKSEMLFPQADLERSMAKLERATVAGNPFRFGTNKASIWQILFDAPEVWLTANDIQERSLETRAIAIPMTSISPTLSEMKDEHLMRKGMKVALKVRLNENGEAEASPDARGVDAPLDH